ncbi:MAG: NUDIX domain-containing protein [Cyclobacteriaceae bacterium]|nr:NUDIX domain-containing protein [Cyclobacteriaceae bacterium]
MKLFINDIPVTFFDSQSIPDNEYFQNDIDASKEDIAQNRLLHHVLIRSITTEQLDELLKKLHEYALNNLYSLTITSEKYDELLAFIKKKYKVIKAAGGLVYKQNKALMIYRLKKWDLPKGKIEKGEDAKTGAVREVEEECNVEVKLLKKICTTYHTYTMKNKDILKKTTWYLMDCVDDSQKTPQLEEDIEELKWMSPKEIHHALQNSYQSIRYVFNKYYALKK